MSSDVDTEILQPRPLYRYWEDMPSDVRPPRTLAERVSAQERARKSYECAIGALLAHLHDANPIGWPYLHDGAIRWQRVAAQHWWVANGAGFRPRD